MERSCKQWQEQLAALALTFLLFAPAFLVPCTATEADGDKDGLASPGKTMPPGWTGDSGSDQGSSPEGSWKYEWGWAAGPGVKISGFGYGYGGSGDAGSGGGGGGGGDSGTGGYGGLPGNYGGNDAGGYNGEAGGEGAFGDGDGAAGGNRRGLFRGGMAEKKVDGGSKN
nr:putative glycine-rich cell wall structural protein 1 [Lolium perenne]